MTDFRKYLNPSQLAAVTAMEGPILVIAGAGSGKTRAIEYRVLHLIENGVRPESILLLTFTRKAAREMLSRATKHNNLCGGTEGGTFHSFAFNILRRYAKMTGFSNSFTILDESDSEAAIHRSMTKLSLEEREKRFPRKSTLRAIISTSVNKDMPLHKVLERDYPHFIEYDKDIDAIRKEYARYKIDKNYMDYDDLLVCLKLLLQNPSVRHAVSQKYRYVMVDEYQDTNKLQDEIAYLLAMDNGNIMAVGDDAQSIYGFRGSSHENIMDFPKKFPECRIIKLEENYRSVQSVLDLANASLENMRNKYSKCLSSVRMDTGEKPSLIFFKDAYEEAEWVAEKIKELRDNESDLSDIAVLFRSAYVSIPLQAELTKRNMPYQVFGGLKFYETAHVKDLMAHFKLIKNSRDELAWHRALSLIEGIGPKHAEKLTEELIVFSSVCDAAKSVLIKYSKGFKYSKGIKKLARVLASASRANLKNEELFEIVFDYYTSFLKECYDDWHLRINDFEAMRQICQRYSNLDEFLADLAIEPPERGVSNVIADAHDGESPLTLSTIHSAKGLEWKTVFLMGLADGLLPISFALDYEDEIEEENRLFYVAVTRAKDTLFLSLHHEGRRGGISQFNKLSRFVDVPNVISCLNPHLIFEPEIRDDDIDYDYAGGAVSIYDKKTLFRSITDRFK